MRVPFVFIIYDTPFVFVVCFSCEVQTVLYRTARVTVTTLLSCFVLLHGKKQPMYVWYGIIIYVCMNGMKVGGCDRRT